MKLWIVLTGIASIVLGLSGMQRVLHPRPGGVRMPFIYPLLSIGGGLALAGYGLLA